MTSLEATLNDRLSTAFAAVAGDRTDPVLRRSQRADFQADGALALAKKLGKAPRDIAQEVLRAADLEDLAETTEIAGPGFINLTLKAGVLGDAAAAMLADAGLGVVPSDRPDRVVVDYSGPNAAKEMHVGHLRSTIIGDACVRLLETLGHTVIRQNHLGEWGTPFGMLIEHLLDIGETETAHELSVGDLGGFYKAARAKFENDPAFADRARQRVVLLQGGDATSLRLWGILVDQSKAYFLDVYALLDSRLTADDFAGESTYNDQLADVTEELERLGLLRESGGALCVFPAGFANREGEPMPLIVKKSDGGYGYDTTDLAAIRYRARDLKATRMLYVIGTPQRMHLAMIFETGREAGWTGPDTRVEHIGFGSVLGADNKMLKSRSGDTEKLIDLLSEAVTRAAAQVREKNPDLPADVAAEVAKAVGMGAVKYADLSTDRIKDYVFDYDRMLAFEGNTAPYLQYANVRVRSIFARGGVTIEQASTGPIVIGESEERTLALALLGYAGVVEGLADSLEFHKLCTYLFGVATAYSAFFEKCPVLKAESEAAKASRLALCALTSRTLEAGLALLGIAAPQQM
jgi:arginyl-tRNA synthetase